MSSRLLPLEWAVLRRAYGSTLIVLAGIGAIIQPAILNTSPDNSADVVPFGEVAHVRRHKLVPRNATCPTGGRTGCAVRATDRRPSCGWHDRWNGCRGDPCRNCWNRLLDIPHRSRRHRSSGVDLRVLQYSSGGSLAVRAWMATVSSPRQPSVGPRILADNSIRGRQPQRTTRAPVWNRHPRYVFDLGRRVHDSSPRHQRWDRDCSDVAA